MDVRRLHEPPSAVRVYPDAPPGLSAQCRGLVWEAGGVTVIFSPASHATAVRIYSPTSAISRVAVRWRLEFSTGAIFLGDAWERGYGDLQWRFTQPERVLPWYFAAHDAASGQTVAVGVKTQPAAMCFWTADSAGVTLNPIDTRVAFEC